jgi:hypothetical protein
MYNELVSQLCSDPSYEGKEMPVIWCNKDENGTGPMTDKRFVIPLKTKASGNQLGFVQQTHFQSNSIRSRKSTLRRCYTRTANSVTSSLITKNYNIKQEVRRRTILTMVSIPSKVLATGTLYQKANQDLATFRKSEPYSQLTWECHYGVQVCKSFIDTIHEVPLKDHRYGLAIRSALINPETGEYSLSVLTPEEVMSFTYTDNEGQIGKVYKLSEPLPKLDREDRECKWDGRIWDPQIC